MRSHWRLCLPLVFIFACGGGDDLTGPSGSQDQDSDGVLNADDRCPSEAEIANHWEDEDGCPDTTDELYQFARTDIEGYWQRAFASAGGSYTRIQVFQGYDTQIETPCGPSIPNNAFFCRLNRGIYYHIPLLDGFLQVGAYAPHFIIAHEFGHSVQNQLGFTRELYPTILLELQADCLGGAYTRDARDRNILEEGDIDAAVLSLFRIGDPLGTPWFDPRAHGSAGQRIDAFNLGVQQGPNSCSLPAAPPPPPPGAASTTTTITTDTPDPSDAGQSVVVNVQVTSAGATPTGSVTVSVLGGTESCSSTLSGGSATCTLVLRIEGTRTLIANYTGNSSFAPSSDTEAHTVRALASAIEKVSGDGQTGPPSSELANPLVVRVFDGNNNPLVGRVVSWVVASGSVSPQNSATDAQGRTSTRWTLGAAVGPYSLTAVVSGVGTVTFTATATAGSPSGSTSTVSASPATITAGGTSTITVTVRDANNNPISGVSVTPAASGSGNNINPSSAPSGSNGVATFSFSSTVAETKTITATAGGVTIEDQATITVQRASSIIEIESDDPDPSVVGQPVTVEFTVRGSGGTPTGTVTVSFSDGTSAEDCSTQLVDGAGSCSITPLTPGGPPNNRRIIRATYSGDNRFSGDTDEENHRVDPVVSANDPPTADFEAPTGCVAGQPCQFTGQSSDEDGVIASRVWTFQDGTPASSGDPNPLVTFASEGSKTVTLTVTDDDGASDTETKQVIVAPAGPTNEAPTAVDDAYSTPGAGQPLTVAAPGVLANDTDDGGSLTAENPSLPEKGTVSLHPDGSFEYFPTPGATGTDSFTYGANDGLLTSRATVSITITP